jgi:hypothetical protein
LAAGKIIAVNGENGPQARILTPGLHIEPLLNLVYHVDISETETEVHKGKVGVLVAKDGAPLLPGQAFADPFPTSLGYQLLNAETFLGNGGERGPQLTVLPPGKYRLNRYLWDIEEVDATEVEAGFVGVVKSNVWSSVDLGILRTAKPDKCDVVQRTVKAGGDAVNRGSQALDAPTVPVGCIGVWQESLPPGQYYLNPAAYKVTKVDTRAQVWTYAGGYVRAKIDLTVDSKGDIQQKRTEEDVPVGKENADRAVFVKMEGWDVPLELRVVAQVSPAEAACVVAGIGTLKDVQDRVLTPSIRAITRDVAGGSYEVTEAKTDENGKPVLDKDGKPIIETVTRPTKVLDLINQRPLIEGEIERRIRPEGEKSCVAIREVRLGEPAIPPELLVAVRREQLATQLGKAFIQEKGAQDLRVASEKAKATADQQVTLVQAEIGVQASLQNAEAARNQGVGERDKLAAIAEGQKKQMDVLGVEATVKLRQYELLLGDVFGFIGQHPEVLQAALSNAQKFVPNISVGGSDATGGLLAALLGQALSSGSLPVAATKSSPGPVSNATQQ